MGDPAASISLLGMLAHADIVVQAVVAALALCSMASWAIIVEKVGRLLVLRRAVAGVEAFAQNPGAGPVGGGPLLARMLDGLGEELDGGAAPEARTRAEAALRAIGLREVRRNEAGLSFLATLASAAPFVGLFGTVWGIMHSFTAIAAAQDTSLASVAPGIAEALLATAVGLAAAIPAVVGYNQIRAALARCGQRLAFAASIIARHATGPAASGRAVR